MTTTQLIAKPGNASRGSTRRFGNEGQHGQRRYRRRRSFKPGLWANVAWIVAWNIVTLLIFFG